MAIGRAQFLENPFKRPWSKLRFTSFARQTMVAVLSPVANNHFVVTIVPFKWERDFQNMMAGLNDVKQAFDFLAFLFSAHARCFPVLNQFFLKDLAWLVVEELNHVKKERIFGIFNSFQVIGYHVVRAQSGLLLNGRWTQLKQSLSTGRRDISQQSCRETQHSPVKYWVTFWLLLNYYYVYDTNDKIHFLESRFIP